MRYYLKIPVIDELQDAILDLYDRKELTSKQAITILNLIREKVEGYNSEHQEQNICRCGRCFKDLSTEKQYSLEHEVKRLSGDSWWDEDLDKEFAFDSICGDCLDFVRGSYFSK